MSDAGLSILAVDDEPAQLRDLARLLRVSRLVGEVECAAGGREALTQVSARSFDAIFLDVRMPGLDGVELSRVLRRFAAPPALVFVTAHEDAAVQAFEVQALDYILKPVGRARLEQALERVAAATSTPAPVSTLVPEPDVIAAANVRSGTTRLLQRAAILYAQSHGDFVRLVTADGRYLLRNTLSDLEHRWGPHGFVRVHRQFLANLNHAVELRPLLGGTAELVFEDGAAIPVARRHAADLGRRVAA